MYIYNFKQSVKLILSIHQQNPADEPKKDVSARDTVDIGPILKEKRQKM